MDMTKPISPDQIAEAKLKVIPEYVFKSVNEMLAEKYVDGREIIIKQPNLVEQILFNGPEGLTKREVYDKGYLNFEEAYRAAGWKVVYDKPAYNEDYDAFFKFSRK